jgi:hypothetical protein
VLASAVGVRGGRNTVPADHEEHRHTCVERMRNGDQLGSQVRRSLRACGASDECGVVNDRHQTGHTTPRVQRLVAWAARDGVLLFRGVRHHVYLCMSEIPKHVFYVSLFGSMANAPLSVTL